MAVREAVLKEIVDRVFPKLDLPWNTHWQEIQKHENNRKSLGWLLYNALESQENDLSEKLVQNFYDALFPNRKLPSQ